MALMLDLEAAAVFLRERTGMEDLTHQWVRTQVDSGKVPCVVVRRKRRIRQDVLEHLINSWLKEAA
jgi:hypothetical protein